MFEYYVFCAVITLIATFVTAGYVKAKGYKKSPYEDCEPWAQVLFFGIVMACLSGIALPVALICLLIYGVVTGIAQFMKHLGVKEIE